jgi:hypothetical protein
VLDRLGHRCGEEECLTAGGLDRGGDLADGLDEAHVEHAVGLVEDENLDGAEIDDALVHQIQQAAGRGDDDVDSAVQRALLMELADAAEDDGVIEAGFAPVDAEALRDLLGELTCGRKDEGAGLFGAAVGLVGHCRGETLDDG